MTDTTVTWKYLYRCKCGKVHETDRPFKEKWVCDCGVLNVGIETAMSSEPSDDTRVFQTGATRGKDDNKLDFEGFISPRVLWRYAEYMHECRLRNVPPGAAIRSSDNWQKGIPTDAYIKSLIRHTMEVWGSHRGAMPEVNSANYIRTLCAIMFNAMGLIFEATRNEFDIKGIDAENRSK